MTSGHLLKTFAKRSPGRLCQDDNVCDSSLNHKLAYSSKQENDADSRIFPVPNVGFGDPWYEGYHGLALLALAGEYPGSKSVGGHLQPVIWALLSSDRVVSSVRVMCASNHYCIPHRECHT